VGQGRQRLLGVRADDEAVRHVADAERRGDPQRPAPGRPLGGAHRRADRYRALVDLVEVLAQVPCQLRRRAAGRRHVDEAKERRPQLLVVRRRLHGTLVERPHRMAERRWQPVVERAADPLELRLDLGGGRCCPLAHHP
jgi:hypothetical protein